MTASAECVLKDALDLLPIERAEIIEKLFQSFDRSKNKEIDAAWAVEIISAPANSVCESIWPCSAARREDLGTRAIPSCRGCLHPPMS